MSKFCLCKIYVCDILQLGTPHECPMDNTYNSAP